MGLCRDGLVRKTVLVGVACAMVWACGPIPGDEADAIEQGILATPGAEDLWATIKAQYPDDFAALVEQVRALSPEEQADPDRAEQVGADWLRDFFARIGPDAVRAPAEQLLIWSATEGELYTSLQRASVQDCAAMTMGEWIMVDDKAGAVTAAIARRNAAMVRASAAGRDDPQTYEAPAEADFAQLGAAIAATGIDPELQAALGSDEAMQALSPEGQCAVGVAVYTGLAALPDDSEPRMAAYMLAPL